MFQPVFAAAMAVSLIWSPEGRMPDLLHKAQLQAEDQTPTGKFTTAGEVKQILELTKGNWVAVREWEGQDLIYVTHLWSWRCGMAQMKISVNGGPAEIWELPPCHIDQGAPNAILDTDGLPYRVFALGSVQTVAVELVLDDLSTMAAQFDRAAIMIP